MDNPQPVRKLGLLTPPRLPLRNSTDHWRGSYGIFWNDTIKFYSQWLIKWH